MSKRSTPPDSFDVTPAHRVPIAMSIALEVVAELRAHERQAAPRIVAEVVRKRPRPKS